MTHQPPHRPTSPVLLGRGDKGKGDCCGGWDGEDNGGGEEAGKKEQEEGQRKGWGGGWGCRNGNEVPDHTSVEV